MRKSAPKFAPGDALVVEACLFRECFFFSSFLQDRAQNRAQLKPQ
jgi:hypothetical protein